MLKHIWKQIRNRWKKNIWIMLELLLIFCLVWYMVDYFFVLGYNKSIQSHRSLENTYMVDLGRLSGDHPDFSQEESEPSANYANLRRIINRIKEHPEVESIALGSGPYSFPVLGALWPMECRSMDDTTKVAEIQYTPFVPEEDYFKVFRHTRDDGKVPVSVADYDWSDPTVILITRMLQERLFPNESAIGKRIEIISVDPGQPRPQYRIIGVLDDLKNSYYSRPYAVAFMSAPFNENSAFIAFRTKTDIPSLQFSTLFKKEMSSQLRIGNFYFKGLTSLAWVEKDSEYKVGITNEIRTYTALMLFLLVSIILCVLGTFWFRANVRREEIGIRRAMGANKMNIHYLFIIEGLILLSIIFIPAMLIEMQFIHAGLVGTMGKDIRAYGDYLPDHQVLRFLITNVITWIILTGMIILAIWYPARSASRIKPVEALRDE